MVRRVRHGLFDLFVEAKRETLHFSEVTPALLWRHGLADFGKVPEHLRLTLRPQRAQFGKLLFGARSDVGCTSQRRFQFPLLGGNLFAHLGALRHVALVHLSNASQLGIC